MILSDTQIRKEIRCGRLKIEPFNDKNITPNGYDLSIGESEVRSAEPMSFFRISTLECVSLPRNLSAQLWIRSSFARRGVFCSFGKVDAGFGGTLTIGCFNSSRDVIEVKEGERFVQIVFETMSSEAERGYEGKYRGQRGITLG